MLQYLVHIAFYYLLSGRLQKDKNKENLNKYVPTRNGRLLVRDAKCSNLTGKLLVFLKTGFLGDATA